ncbi:MAG: hypothetical protein J5785_06320 [Spirochaetales bacterium]|nr:hypothetical protein [Spirochaetales bacterium]
MKNLVCRIKIYLSNPKKLVSSIIKIFFSIIGGVYTLFEIHDSVFSGKDWIDWFSGYFYLFCIGSLIISIVFSIEWKTSFSCLVKDYDITISLKMGDVTRKKSAVVIPTNSSFVITKENRCIADDSVQGAYQNRYFRKKEGELSRLLEKALRLEECHDEHLLLFGIPYPIYDIGTTAVIEYKTKVSYWVAINDFNEFGQNKKAKIDDLYKALNGLWNSIKDKGHVEKELCIPLIASGHAGIAEATRGQVIEAIIDSFLVTIVNNKFKIADHLSIVLFPPDLDKIDLNREKEYLKYKCSFINKVDTKCTGVLI